ncbi:MAG: carboxylating nicotinate-nucleotide diphosphorylase [Gammaproteobacteria bacterium]|nr:carboxylating nicotinate-nucleotide diphosphorylase [Gammaproteobacteria bacterium]
MIDRDGVHILANMEPDADTVKRNVAAALAEDVGSGDVSAELIDAAVHARARIVTREPGVFCGRAWAEETCRQVDPAIRLDWRVDDGAHIERDDTLVDFNGPARGLLTAERTVLNFLQLLSGTATRTRRFVDAVAGTEAVILDTRKTLPGLRVAQKHAVRIGGGQNHRMGLFDAILLKENHIAAAGGIAAAACEARGRHPGMAVEVEVEDQGELAEAIAAGVDRILLDNFSILDLHAAVAANAARLPLEASGGITLDNVAEVARAGVDYVSVGELTKNVMPLDLSMRFVGDLAGAGRRT